MELKSIADYLENALKKSTTASPEVRERNEEIVKLIRKHLDVQEKLDKLIKSSCEKSFATQNSLERNYVMGLNNAYYEVWKLLYEE